MKVRFATSNAGKAREAAAALAPLGIQIETVSVPVDEIQADRLEDVARAKAEALRSRVRPPYFVEDAGLFVDALKGFPGVYSAYAYRTLGWQGLLRLLGTRRNRGAEFCAVVALVLNDAPPRLFRGAVRGRLTEGGRGAHGFGFDPIFVPAGHRRTFAELEPDQKTRLSHRGRALAQLGRALKRQARH